MADESLISLSPVVDVDIPMTVNEVLLNKTLIVETDIPMTVNEVWLGMTLVLGMPDEYKRNFICNDTVSTDNRSKQTGVYVDGGVFVPIQGNMPNNQLGS
jgi:hypothetical protein